MTLDTYLPSVSVIITTFRRPQSLARLLDIMVGQAHIDWHAHEIIIVDDGTEPKFDLTSGNWCDTANITYLYKPRDEGSPYLYGNMNWAARVASKDILWFVQDDLIVDFHSMLILQLLHAAWPDTVMWAHLANAADPSWYQYPGSINPCVEEEQAHGFAWAGCSVPRKWWEALGGADEQFDGSMGFADQDFAIRAWRMPGVDVALVRGICCFIDDDESRGSWRNKILTPWRAAHPDEHDPNGPKLWAKWPHRKPANA